MITFASVKNARDGLIAAGITSGVKRARLQHRLLYGTREVAIVLIIRKEDQSCKDNMR